MEDPVNRLRYLYKKIIQNSEYGSETENLQKYNPYHDRMGRFSSAQGFTVYSPDKTLVRSASYAQRHIIGAFGKNNLKSVKESATASGCKVYGIKGSLKPESQIRKEIYAESKVRAEYPVRTGYLKHDSSIYRMGVPERRGKDAVEAAVAEMKAKGYTPVMVTNTMGDAKAANRCVSVAFVKSSQNITYSPTTKRKVTIPNSFTVEFHTNKSVRLENANRKLYNQLSSEKDPQKRSSILEQMKTNSSKFTVPSGMDGTFNFQ